MQVSAGLPATFHCHAFVNVSLHAYWEWMDHRARAKINVSVVICRRLLTLMAVGLFYQGNSSHKQHIISSSANTARSLLLPLQPL